MRRLRRSTRSGFAGARRIVRFNWPIYVVALLVALACLYVLARHASWRAPAAVALALSCGWTISSLVASHLVYDHSPLSDWSDLARWLPPPYGRWMVVRTGFDASLGRIEAQLPPGEGTIVDLYGAPGVGGGSVRRARKESATTSPIVATALPDAEAAFGAILAVFALHEVRGAGARAAVFRDLTRALAPGGRLLVVEHLRDWRNFLAYGPGFLHFLPEREWRRCAALAGFELERELAVTPFVRVFVWCRAGPGTAR